MTQEKANEKKLLYEYLKKISDTALPLQAVQDLDAYHATGRNDSVYRLRNRILSDIEMRLSNIEPGLDSIYAMICGLSLVVAGVSLKSKGYNWPFIAFSLSGFCAVSYGYATGLYQQYVRKRLRETTNVLGGNCDLLFETLDENKGKLGALIPTDLETKVA